MGYSFHISQVIACDTWPSWDRHFIISFLNIMSNWRFSYTTTNIASITMHWGASAGCEWRAAQWIEWRKKRSISPNFIADRHETWWGGRSSNDTFRNQSVLSWCMYLPNHGLLDAFFVTRLTLRSTPPVPVMINGLLRPGMLRHNTSNHVSIYFFK